MGLFSKYESKYKLNKNGSLVLAKYPAGGYALIKNGKVIEDNLKSVSRNVVNTQENDNKEVFYVKTRDGNYKIYSFDDGSLILGDLNPQKNDIVEITHQDESIIVDFGIGKWIVNTRGYAISEDYSYVGEKNENSFRKVQKLNGGLDKSYYIDENAQKVSPDFLQEKEAGVDYKILRCRDKYNAFQDYIWSKDGEFLSRGFDKLDYVNGRFLVSKADRVYFVDQLGERRTKDLSEYEILNDGTLIAKELSGGETVVFDKSYGTVTVLKKPLVDVNAGVIVGEDINGKTIMMGYNNKAYEVNPVASRLIVKRLMGKSFNRKLLNQVLTEEIDISSTLEVYENIISENLVKDKKNKMLKWLNVNARETLVADLDNARTGRLKIENEAERGALEGEE